MTKGMITMATCTRACATGDIKPEDLIRFDHLSQTFCIYRSPDGAFFATDGVCTHERVHLSEGLVIDNVVECPKHNAQFDYRTGEAVRAPACVNLQTFPVKVEDGHVYIEI
jgi:3-phenylpropionate/trans-cinnamate dioxygenase ferredoxin subunit